MLSLYQVTTLLALSIGFVNCQGPTETDKATSTTSITRSTSTDGKTKTKSPADIVNDMKYEDSTGQQFFDDAGGNDTGAKSSDIVLPPKEKEVIVCPDKYARTCESDGWSLKWYGCNSPLSTYLIRMLTLWTSRIVKTKIIVHSQENVLEFSIIKSSRV